MDDKTSSRLQPSTAFGHSTPSTSTHPLLNPSTSSPTHPSPTSINSILHHINPVVTMEQKKQFDVKNTLMSPPEPTPLDNFAIATLKPAMDSSKTPHLTGASLISPPVSPETALVDATGTATENLATVAVRDPILFESQDSQASSSPQAPLFEEDNRAVVKKHIAARRQEDIFKWNTPPPDTSEYQLALEFKSKVVQSYLRNPNAWRRREREQLRQDDAARPGARRYTNIAPAHPGGRKQAAKQATGMKQPRVAKAPRAIKPPRHSTPSVEKEKRIAREDRNFLELPDFSPPTSSLPSKANSLKVDWKGAPIDLRQDPDVGLLHPDELILAANLRLDCATYLTSKRRIFIKRIEALRIKKEFRKTDAQQACKIDVNKASKLWQAFDKVGWLDSSWVRKYL